VYFVDPKPTQSNRVNYFPIIVCSPLCVEISHLEIQCFLPVSLVVGGGSEGSSISCRRTHVFTCVQIPVDLAARQL
jgi:hypothetical protein